MKTEYRISLNCVSLISATHYKTHQPIKYSLILFVKTWRWFSKNVAPLAFIDNKCCYLRAILSATPKSKSCLKPSPKPPSNHQLPSHISHIILKQNWNWVFGTFYLPTTGKSWNLNPSERILLDIILERLVEGLLNTVNWL